ncbi:MAG: hypothetical protein LUI07_09095, partial [Lachnospiraceae bacterium]|nr:hypothetical protein [Lachnospiraceae bacterium]
MRTEQHAPANSHPSYQQEQVSPFQQTEAQNSTFVQSETQQDMNGNPNPEPYSSPLNHSPYTAEPVASSTSPATPSHLNHYYTAAMEQHSGRRHYTQRQDTEQYFQSQPQSESAHAESRQSYRSEQPLHQNMAESYQTQATENGNSSEPASVRDNHIPSNHRTERTPVNRQQSGEQLNFNTVTAEPTSTHTDVREPQRFQQFNAVPVQNQDTGHPASSASRPQAQRHSSLQDNRSDISSVQATTPVYAAEHATPVQDNGIPANHRTDHIAVNEQSQSVPLNTTPVSATSHDSHVVVAETHRQQQFDPVPVQNQDTQRPASSVSRPQAQRQSQIQGKHSDTPSVQATTPVYTSEHSTPVQDNGIPVNHRTDHVAVNTQPQDVTLNTTPVSTQSQNVQRPATGMTRPQARRQSQAQGNRSDLSSVQATTPVYAVEHSTPVQDNGIPVNHRTDRAAINGQSQNVPLNTSPASAQSQNVQHPATGRTRQQARRQSQLQDHHPAVDTGQSTPATTPAVVSPRVQPRESGIRTRDNGIPVNHRIDPSISPVQETDGHLNLNAPTGENSTPAITPKAPKKRTRLQECKPTADSGLTAPATSENNPLSAAQKRTPLSANHATPETAAAVTPVQKTAPDAQASKKPRSTKAIESPAKKAPPANAKEIPAQQSAARDNGIDLNHRLESPISIRSKQGAAQGTPTIAKGEENPNAAKVAALKKRQRRLSQEKKGAESLRESSDQDGFSQKKQPVKSKKTASSKGSARPPSKEEAAAQAAEKKASKKKKAVQDGEAAKA